MPVAAFKYTDCSARFYNYLVQEPQSKLWKQIPQQAAGLFNLPIPLHCVFGIGVSQYLSMAFKS